MSDEGLRLLERRAAQADGDPAAFHRLERARYRAGLSLERDPRRDPLPGDVVEASRSLYPLARRIVDCPPSGRARPPGWTGVFDPWVCDEPRPYMSYRCKRVHWAREYGKGPTAGTLIHLKSWCRWARTGQIIALVQPRLALLRKHVRKRTPIHYDSLPHTNCLDPAHCDCECPGCLRVWAEEDHPGINRKEWR